jgi:hypothetical protein
MNINKWLSRKYPESFKKISEFLDEKMLYKLKIEKFRIGTLKKFIIADNIADEEILYPKGTMVMWKRYKFYDEGLWTGCFDIYCLAKCKEGFTSSGYHSIFVKESDIEEVLK